MRVLRVAFRDSVAVGPSHRFTQSLPNSDIRDDQSMEWKSDCVWLTVGGLLTVVPMSNIRSMDLEPKPTGIESKPALIDAQRKRPRKD